MAEYFRTQIITYISYKQIYVRTMTKSILDEYWCAFLTYRYYQTQRLNVPVLRKGMVEVKRLKQVGTCYDLHSKFQLLWGAHSRLVWAFICWPLLQQNYHSLSCEKSDLIKKSCSALDTPNMQSHMCCIIHVSKYMSGRWRKVH